MTLRILRLWLGTACVLSTSAWAALVCYLPNPGPDVIVCATQAAPYDYVGLCCPTTMYCMVPTNPQQTACCPPDYTTCYGSSGSGTCCSPGYPYCVDDGPASQQHCARTCPADKETCGAHECCNNTEFCSNDKCYPLSGSPGPGGGRPSQSPDGGPGGPGKGPQNPPNYRGSCGYDPVMLTSGNSFLSVADVELGELNFKRVFNSDETLWGGMVAMEGVPLPFGTSVATQYGSEWTHEAFAFVHDMGRSGSCMKWAAVWLPFLHASACVVQSAHRRKGFLLAPGLRRLPMVSVSTDSMEQHCFLSLGIARRALTAALETHIISSPKWSMPKARSNLT